MPLKKENGKITITYKLKFIDSYRFMSTSLSNLVDNLSGIYKECKKCMQRKKIRLTCEFIGRLMVDWIINAKNAKDHTLS